ADTVERGSYARDEIPILRHVVHARKIEGGDVPARWRLGRGRIDADVVEPTAQVQREPSNGPLILREESHVGPLAELVLPRRGPLGERHGFTAGGEAVAEAVGDIEVRPVESSVEVLLRKVRVDAGFE